VEVGFYGKLPSHGDFLRRRVSDAFVDGWDAWLRASVAASRAVMGERWTNVFLTSPVWRFVCTPRACGPAGVIGLMAPSVDRVGRCFPFTLVAELPPDVSVITTVRETAWFFDRADRLVVETLAQDHVDFETFNARVADLQDELESVGGSPRVTLDVAASAIVNEGTTGGWQFPIGSPALMGPVFEQLLSLRLAALYDPLALWWTEGSSIVEPGCLITRGLPDPERFAALLDGSWAASRWQTVTTRLEPAQTVSTRLDPAQDGTLVKGVPLSFRSVAATDVGRSRKTNQDAFLERSEVGVWVVADGVGGHRDGDVASRMVCDALADFEPHPSFADTVDAARRRLGEVNEQLLRSSKHAGLPDRSASTVALLLVRGGSCAMLWAGDSRVYRWRTGRLECLTRDHSAEKPDALTGGQTTNEITRAVGVEPTLSLDVERGDVRAGDRFLLCSDGLTRVVPEAQIQDWMQHADIRLAVEGLIQATLDAGAPDNVTVLIVEAWV